MPKDMVDPEDPKIYSRAGNVQINTLLGAETLEVGTSMEEAIEYVRSKGGKPYEIPSGASMLTLSTHHTFETGKRVLTPHPEVNIPSAALATLAG